MIHQKEVPGSTKYAIDYGRFDVPTQTLMQFWADTDNEAIAYFHGIANQPQYAWERMSLYACEVIQVISPRRHLASNSKD